jgi:hypothetical protein
MRDIMVEFFLPASMWLVGAAILAIIGLSIYNIIQNPKTAIGILTSLIILVAIFLVGYVFAGGGEQLQVAIERGIGDGVSRMIGAMLNMVYIMLIVILGVIIWGIVAPLFSK